MTEDGEDGDGGGRGEGKEGKEGKEGRGGEGKGEGKYGDDGDDDEDEEDGGKQQDLTLAEERAARERAEKRAAERAARAAEEAKEQHRIAAEKRALRKAAEKAAAEAARVAEEAKQGVENEQIGALEKRLGTLSWLLSLFPPEHVVPPLSQEGLAKVDHLVTVLRDEVDLERRVVADAAAAAEFARTSYDPLRSLEIRGGAEASVRASTSMMRERQDGGGSGRGGSE